MARSPVAHGVDNVAGDALHEVSPRVPRGGMRLVEDVGEDHLRWKAVEGRRRSCKAMGGGVRRWKAMWKAVDCSLETSEGSR